jgi:predicted lactoylglutathione lyase
MINSIFVNLPVRSLSRSVDFFTAMGFTFNPQFTSDDSTCMLVGENIYAMLLEDERFKSFIDKPIADSSTTEVLVSLGLDSKEEVTKLAEAAFAAGARRYKESEDLGFMFSWGFEDLDGHIWELFWMDPANVQ